jgi:hypothetical protein
MRRRVTRTSGLSLIIAFWSLIIRPQGACVRNIVVCGGVAAGLILWTGVIMNFRNARASLASLVLAVGLLAPVARAAAVKDYQVTGQVLEVSKTAVTVQKGDEKWEIELTADTKIDGELKVGEKVTIHYKMVAKDVEKKADAK